MKILLHSNHANVPTGYGIQTALLARRLKAAGHQVAISTYYGHQIGLGEWEGIPVYPCAGESYGNDILHEHAIRFFEGDPLGGWIVPIMDVFGLTSPVLKDFNVAAWTPVDHFPVPQSVRDFFKHSEAVPIAMSKFGEDLLRQSGLDPLYAPLAVDTNIFKPVEGAKELLGIDPDRYVVMMNGMNKGWALHRKGFPEAFMAFAQFAKDHPEALLYMHTEKYGPHAQGINLIDLAIHSGVPEHQIKFCDQYDYRCGMISAQEMAVAYSAADVLLAPSRGEGFCVPLIEAQACGTPVIVTDFSAQPELVGAGWKVTGQPEWEAAQTGWVIKADIPAIITALEQCFGRDKKQIARDKKLAIGKAREYDADLIFESCWKPILAELEGRPVGHEPADPIPDENAVAVLVPVLNRPANVAPLVESFNNATGSEARLYFVVDQDDTDEIAAIKAAGAQMLVSDRGSSYAQKVNSGFAQTSEPWVFLCGDDVRFHPGWVDAARKVSERFDVIGTNDTVDGPVNPRVAAGVHADHFFVRRSYVEDDGGCLGGGTVMFEGYKHFYSDVETIELARARGVFTPCLDSVVEHLHPDIGKAEVDDTYKLGWGFRDHDKAQWDKRKPLVAMQASGRSKIRAA